MFATAAMLLMVGSSGMASQPAQAADFAVHPLHDGDAGHYDVVYEGDWRHDGAPVGERPGPRFQVLPAADVRAANGRLIEALPILWQSERPSMAPASAGPAWAEHHVRHWWSQGQVLATQSHEIRQASATVQHASALVYDPFVHCLLLAADALRLPEGCRLDDAQVTVPAGTPLTVTTEGRGMLSLRHVVAAGPVHMEWWFAADLPVPLAFRFDARGPHGEPRSAHYTLRGFRHGDGHDLPQATAILARPVATAPIEAWGLSDDGVDHPFRLSTAFEAALTSATFDELRKWMQRNPHAYVYRAAYHEDHAGRDPVRHWTLHLSDGADGFSVRISQSNGVQLLGLGGVRFERLEVPADAHKAPPLAGLAHAPTIASVWGRWADHVSAAERNQGANAWAFEILQTLDGPTITVAGGRATQLYWGPQGLALPALGSTGSAVSLVTLDGSGQTLRFDRHAQGPAEHIDTPREAAPIHVAGYAATGWAMPHGGTVAGLGLVATLVGALYLAWPLTKTGALALFSRLRPHELLHDPTRATIMDALHGEPGLHFRALCDRLGANPGRIRHHVHKLEQGGLIRARQTPGYTCYFPAATSRSVLDAGPLLRSDGARNLLLALTRRPGACAKDLAGEAGLSAATATYHIKRMQEAGMVDAQRDGRAVRLRLTPGGAQAAAAMGLA